MCVPVPGLVISLKADTAIVSANDTQLEVGRQFLRAAQPGDWVLMYLGQMVSVVEAEEASALCDLLGELRAPLGQPPEKSAEAPPLLG